MGSDQVIQVKSITEEHPLYPISIKKDPATVTCKGGFDWFNKNEANPNVLDGALVGGPDENDGYTDSRSNYQMAEPATANTAPLVGVLARLA